MDKAWAKIQELHEANAKHVRKGFRLAEASGEDILRHADDEIEELRQSPDDMDELADSLACLLHYAISKGWRQDDVEAAMIRKLAERFE